MSPWRVRLIVSRSTLSVSCGFIARWCRVCIVPAETPFSLPPRRIFPFFPRGAVVAFPPRESRRSRFLLRLSFFYLSCFFLRAPFPLCRLCWQFRSSHLQRVLGDPGTSCRLGCLNLLLRPFAVAGTAVFLSPHLPPNGRVSPVPKQSHPFPQFFLGGGALPLFFYIRA